jgi:hypothetical protein
MILPSIRVLEKVNEIGLLPCPIYKNLLKMDFTFKHKTSNYTTTRRKHREKAS